MSKEEYLDQVIKSLKVADKIKYRILSDIETELECLLEEGMDMSEIIKLKGMPSSVAYSFNEAYSGTPIARQYYNQKRYRDISVVVILLSFLFFIISIVTGFVNFDSVIDGGCSGPTVIIESSNYVLISAIAITSLVIGVICLIVGVASLFYHNKLRSKI